MSLSLSISWRENFLPEIGMTQKEFISPENISESSTLLHNKTAALHRRLNNWSSAHANQHHSLSAMGEIHMDQSIIKTHWNHLRSHSTFTANLICPLPAELHLSPSSTWQVSQAGPAFLYLAAQEPPVPRRVRSTSQSQCQVSYWPPGLGMGWQSWEQTILSDCPLSLLGMSTLLFSSKICFWARDT